jgi:hypothetical protein
MKGNVSAAWRRHARGLLQHLPTCGSAMKTAKAEKIGKTLPMHLSQIEKALT